MGYFQYPTLYSANYIAGDNKAAALIPGAAPDHRAATERSNESADEIGCAARRGGSSGRRPSMMNGEEDGTRSRCFVLCLCEAPKKMGGRQGVFEITHSSLLLLYKYLSGCSD